MTWGLAVLPLSLLAACDEKECETGTACDTGAESESEADSDTETDSETETDSTRDTATGLVHFFGHAETSGGLFVSGQFGYRVTDGESAAPICDALSEWTDTRVPPPPGCPGCEWAFELTLSGGTAIGSACEDMLPSPMTGSEWDGFTSAWGFASTYEYDYHGSSYTVDGPVMLYYDSYDSGWISVALGSSLDTYVSGDAESVTFSWYGGYIYTYL